MSTPDLAGYHADPHRAARHPRPGRGGRRRRSGRSPPVRRLRPLLEGLRGKMLAHHTIEDDICFPALIERVPAAAELIGRTDADHHRLDEVMTAATAQIEALSAGRPAPELASVLAELDELMDHHLAFEDADILPRFEEHFSGEEWNQLDAGPRSTSASDSRPPSACPSWHRCSTPTTSKRCSARPRARSRCSTGSPGSATAGWHRSHWEPRPSGFPPDARKAPCPTPRS